jgi:hypothetical protein
LPLLLFVCTNLKLTERRGRRRRRKNKKYNEVELRCLFLRLKKINKVNIRVIDSDHLASFRQGIEGSGPGAGAGVRKCKEALNVIKIMNPRGLKISFRSSGAWRRI